MYKLATLLFAISIFGLFNTVEANEKSIAACVACAASKHRLSLALEKKDHMSALTFTREQSRLCKAVTESSCGPAWTIHKKMTHRVRQYSK